MTRSLRLGATLLALAFSLPGCAGTSKLDYGHLFQRAGWQHPDRVIHALGVRPGQHVADIGAGDGYFTFRLAEAVGPDGIVYAVEVDEAKLAGLREAARTRGAANVRIVHGGADDARLPDGAVDRVLLVNTYHHIDDRVAYFRRLRQDLAPAGRVGNVDMRDDLTGVLRLFATDGHWIAVERVREEMAEAGYRPAGSYDFLPVQSFEVFEAPGTAP